MSATGIAFIDLSIAIVVEAVAYFGLRRLIRIAHDGAVRASLRAGAANTGLPRRARATATRIAFVRCAVAIIVQTVACFVRRQIRLITNDRARGTCRRADATNAESAGVAGLSASWIALVDGSIAIVVFVVADFIRRRIALYTNERSALALEGSGSAYARKLRRARAAALRIAFIDGAIAVVVDVVAAFGCWKNRLHAGERSILTTENALRTGSLFACYGAGTSGTGIAFVGGAVAIVVQTVAGFGGRLRVLCTSDIAAVARGRTCGAHAKLPGRAGHAAARVAFVRLSVTIVVLAVADFGRWRDVGDALQCTARTNLRSGRTHARLSGDTIASTAGVIFIGRTIAIVVDSVTNLGRWRAGRARLHLPARTRRHGRRACAHAAGDRSEVVVDEQVAIVVDPIAGFGLRRKWRARLRHSIDARFDGYETRTSAARDVRDVLVRFGVAIIVQTVATLVLGQHFAVACAPRSARARLRTGLAFAHILCGHAAGIAFSSFTIDCTRTTDAIVDHAIAILVGTVACFR